MMNSIGHILKWPLVLFSFSLCNFCLNVNGSKILFATFVSSRSHQNIYEPLLFELANRGHQVTLVTPVKTGKIMPNFREINTPSMEHLIDAHSQTVFEQRQGEVSPWKKIWSNPFMRGETFAEVCRDAYKSTNWRIVLEEQWDLVILKTFQNECTYGISHILNTSTILVTTTSPFGWNVGSMGGNSPTSFIPGFGLPGATALEPMTFWQRFGNLLIELMIDGIRRFIYLPIMESVYQEFLGPGLPSSDIIERNASLILINAHFSLNHPRPLLPDMIEVGGMHVHAAKPLPKNLEEFASGSGEDGFIYFSMGSILKANMMPKTTAKAFFTAFSKLKQRVIWKWEGGHDLEIPENVLVDSWLPQQDILGHKNIRGFITHGGLLSLEETVFHGVPLIGIPMFGDQPFNMKQAEIAGFALTLNFNELDENVIFNAIQTLVNEPKYLKRAQEVSKIFRDRLETPLNTAVYWIDYVLRHNGAIHMRSAGRQLNFWQYHSIDVVTTLILILLILMTGILIGFTYLIYLIRGVGKSVHKIDVQTSKKIK